MLLNAHSIIISLVLLAKLLRTYSNTAPTPSSSRALTLQGKSCKFTYNACLNDVSSLHSKLLFSNFTDILPHISFQYSTMLVLRNSIPQSHQDLSWNMPVDSHIINCMIKLGHFYSATLSPFLSSHGKSEV